MDTPRLFTGLVDDQSDKHVHSKHAKRLKTSLKSRNKELEAQLCDADYRRYFEQLNRDKLKSSFFLEDLPEIRSRNAFRIDKRGDKNNMCFDSVHFKQLSNYTRPLEAGQARVDRSKGSFSQTKNKKRMSRTQLRRKQIEAANQRRYFSLIPNSEANEPVKRLTAPSTSDAQPLQSSSLSNKMWLYLETKSQLEAEEAGRLDLTSDYTKYLYAHKHDVNKWLEFIDYQSRVHATGESAGAQAIPLASLFERKLAIFDKALEANPLSLRLRLERLKYRARSLELIPDYNALETVENEFVALLATEATNAHRRTTAVLASRLPATGWQNESRTLLAKLFEIWHEYLRFLLINSNSSSVHFGKMRRTFVQCFAFFLTNSSRNALVDQTKSSELFFVGILHVLRNYASFLCRYGYVEKAIGAFQALLDYNLSRSSSNSEAVKTKALFELYWDIGLPKFGEEHSTGWLDCLTRRKELFALLEERHDLVNAHRRNDDRLELVEEAILAEPSSRSRIEYK